VIERPGLKMFGPGRGRRVLVRVRFLAPRGSCSGQDMHECQGSVHGLGNGYRPR